MPLKLSGKVAVVTGASKGIGAGIAKQMAADGASVVVNYASSKDAADKVVAEITAAGGRAVAVHANMTKKDEIQKLFAETIKAFGRLDILVNNAGIYEFWPLEKVDEEHFHRHFNLNVLGVILATQEAVKHFGPDGGSVINISSLAARAAPPGTSVYSATKGALNSLTRSLASELGPRKIRVNSINPGLVITEGAQGIAEGDFGDHVLRITPLGRLGLPQDIAPAAVFLASADASWISGECFYISGGYR